METHLWKRSLILSRKRSWSSLVTPTNRSTRSLALVSASAVVAAAAVAFCSAMATRTTNRCSR